MDTKRTCGTCTKCCEGYLSGEAFGHTFYPGKPCHFIAIGKGCSIYDKRPQDPCVSYKCGWLTSEDIPEWMKPSDINAIIDMRKIEGIEYLSVIEAGETLKSEVLSWVIEFAISKGFNLLWQVNGFKHWIGSPEFQEKISIPNKLL